MTTILNEWTKKLGQRHWSKADSCTTLCGKPMLGNNYARIISDDSKNDCSECLQETRKLLMGDIADMILEGILCEECGVLVATDGVAPGHPQLCSPCKELENAGKSWNEERH